MSELTTTRDHLRSIADWKPPEVSRVAYWCRSGRGFDALHDRCVGEPCACNCHPLLVGPTDADRALAKRLADEIDDHLNAQAADDGAGLWEEGA